MERIALAIGAHPDDIEFKMSGTLLLLKAAGWEIHYLNIADGCCGSTRYGPAKLRKLREAEARHACAILGAQFHRSLCHDLEILYSLALLRRLAAIVREVDPGIILTHPPVDYMEDHTNACRLAVTAAFARGMPNFETIPPRKNVDSETVIYHCMPHGLTDPLGRAVSPQFFVNTTPVQETMRRAQLAHKSQHDWLRSSQEMESFVKSIEGASLAVGKLSRKFLHAEGWWRHSHLGFASEDSDPLVKELGADQIKRQKSKGFIYAT
jgi:LmbE family N-acetylglucosaminyl deacetylase